MKVYKDNDGIMHVEYPLHSILTVYDVQKEYKKRLEITNKRTPLLVKVHGLVSFDVEAQDFLCSADHCAITSAAAVVTDSKAGFFEYSNMLIGSFKDFRKPGFDFKVFENNEAALEWLKNYL